MVCPPRRAVAKCTSPTGLAAAGSGHARDRHRDIGMRARDGAFGQRARHRLADRAMRVDDCRGNAQHLVLGGVGIDHKAALHDVG